MALDGIYRVPMIVGQVKCDSKGELIVSLDRHSLTSSSKYSVILCNRIQIIRPHVYEDDNTIKLCNHSEVYDVKPGMKITTCNLTCKLDFKDQGATENSIVAEIGVRYGSTLLANYQGIKEYYAFELNSRYCELILGLVSDPKVHIIQGAAQDTLLNLPSEVKFDYVFFDASHHFTTDSLIWNSLRYHLHNKSVVIFDDSHLPDIQYLMEIAKSQNICEIRDN